MLEEQNLSKMLNERLNLSLPDIVPVDFMGEWKSFVRRYGSILESVLKKIKTFYFNGFSAYLIKICLQNQVESEVKLFGFNTDI